MSIKDCKKLFGDRCYVCGRGVFRKKSDYAKHHTDYKNNMGILVCYLCHELINFNKVWRHPIFSMFGKDRGALVYAKRVIAAYKRAKKFE